jgi:tRNA-2-methylthio-N6-dimethylallyladenosine synthase
MDRGTIIPGRPMDGKVKAFVTIMQGCDNFCTFCVVPYVRGREESRAPEEIIDEIKCLADHGVKEVTLLGQNVNSYGKGLPRPITFPELLYKIEEIVGIERIRFTTSHPKDLSPELINSFGHLKKLCEHLHLPVQSGSNRILRMMNRGYTREEYMEKINRLREIKKGIALTSDIMVGFPGEREEDFEDSLDLIKNVRFHGLYSFKYSDRPMVRSASFNEKIPEEVKKRRLSILQAIQEKITEERNHEYEGTLQEVLVEGIKEADSWGNLYGRTRTNTICHFQGERELIGSIVQVRIEKALKNSLLGRIV